MDPSGPFAWTWPSHTDARRLPLAPAGAAGLERPAGAAGLKRPPRGERAKIAGSTPLAEATIGDTIAGAT
jgi:hypothetical protein